MSLKSASAEVFNWNIINEVASEKKKLFVIVTKAKVCVCGCHGRHIIDAMLGVFDWIMLAGVHPIGQA